MRLGLEGFSWRSSCLKAEVTLSWPEFSPFSHLMLERACDWLLRNSFVRILFVAKDSSIKILDYRCDSCCCDCLGSYFFGRLEMCTGTYPLTRLCGSALNDTIGL